jgi:serine phosphatase RsbU (regulator of sigma subunit)
LVELQQFDGARDALALIDALGCDVLLPLLHRGLLLGLGLLKEPPETRDLSGFYSGMRAYMTVAVANTFLDAEARGRSELAKSFDLATTMQESLMPDERPVRRDGFELKGLFKPVAECGGDLWAWRELSDGKVLLLIADATGHGAAPALLAAVAKGAIDAHWQMGLKTLEPETLLASLNAAIHRTGRKRYMMTAFAAVVDTVKGELRYANAGQNFPYFINGSGPKKGQVEPLIARGNSLGAASEAKFERHTRPMGDGDKLFLFTDGVTDAGTPSIDPWGEKRFRASLTANADKRAIHLPDLIMAEVDQHIAGRELMDDVTMLVFEYGHAGDKA